MTPTNHQPFTAGRLWYILYHAPKTWLEDQRDQANGQRGDEAMRIAAAALPPASLPEPLPSSPSCRFLTGARFFHQTIFCARSFEWACGIHVRLEIFSDGTLDAGHCATLKRALPHATIVSDETVTTRLERVLPTAHFPFLRRMRSFHPLMRKVLDLHAGLEGPSLYLDSDMLFFAQPTTLHRWLSAPAEEYFMQQQGDGLVGDREYLQRKLGQPLLPGVNSGIIALNDSAIDWPALEKAAGQLTPGEQSHQWAEQTLFALYLSRRGASPLSPADYVLCHNREQVAPNPPVLRHYVNKAKAIYAASEWRRWLEISEISLPHPL